jgi:flagellar basal-body rod protein FlgF
VHFDPTDTDITISSNGAISTAAGAKGTLKLTEFADPQTLTRIGNNYFSGTGGATATATSLVQGSVEHSNVSGVTEMTQMIRVQRAYETLANLMQQQDQLRNTAVQRLGDMNA